ncbi:MFS general substrate transporter [Teratosphaeria nubilosa]|uniref:MFS general substrate transporter n=1 Tax=Teratosphaeria nubilosa TaxID=161662 RepID=A0A6G1L160_9PEZI|nr:MFS general substrate transporter [Teratosphaeria nubilosa]
MKSRSNEDLKKVVQFSQIERTTSSETETTNDARIDAFTPEQQKAIIRRIDRRLVLTLGFMYCVSLMDRTNLGIAAVAGMSVDLKLIGNRYSLISLVFFISYILLQPPATVVLRKAGPRIFLPTITLLWGITMICFGFVTVWTTMLPLRVVLGIFEAGFFPGCAYLLSCWYPRFELQKRKAVFYLIGSLSSAFSGIMAYGFFKMNGLGDLGPAYGQHYGPTKAHPHAASGIMPGIAGWRWIFIMQGLITVCVGVIGALMIADFPEKAAQKTRSFAIPFLNEREAAFVVARIEHDREDAIAEPFNLAKYLRCACDTKIWGFAWIFGLTATNTYAIAYFLPIILKDGMGFDLEMAECLIAPPYVFAALWMFGCAWLGDRYRIRGAFVILNAILGIIGLPLLGFARSNAVRYLGVFLATTACNANIPCILTYQANNIRGQWKRALASATLVGAGGVGGIVGTTVFRSQDAPAYRPGIYATLIASVLIVIITLGLSLKFHRANKRAEAGGKVIEGLAGFRYTL